MGNLFPSGIKPPRTIRNFTYVSFITILCDYKCANMLPERDGSKMNRRSIEIWEEMRKRGKRIKGDKESEIYFVLELNLLRERSDIIKTDTRCVI